MSAYQPPVQDMIFLLHHVLGFKNEALDAETCAAVLGEAAKLATDVLAPLNAIGDKNGVTLKDGAVQTAPGFKDAYAAYRQGGWNAVPFPEEYGGQNLPWALAFPIQEMWQGANMSFGLCPLLNQGAVEALLSHGTQEQKMFYLPKLISGEWTGTMNLTEPQAGSDLGLLRAKAEKQKDGTYKISGQKIFITYGEHDMADNIIHLVLARLPDAPDDVKGISLFIVPKFLESGERNTVQCIGIEHKLGIHASPTCTMEFSGATGFLLGEENQGLKCMFTMMNNARLSVGLQGVAIAGRACQHALHYANERIQGKAFDSGARVAIAEHADVQRMLLAMTSQVEAGRALTYAAAVALDRAEEGDEAARARVDLMTPIVKSWCTDMALEVTSLGVQVHGGMGFIEETGAAQFYRDARILPIYEGTNGIQAADLVFRKILRDDGAAAKDFIDEMGRSISDNVSMQLAPHLALLREVTQNLVTLGKNKELDCLAGAATPYLKAFGVIAGAAFLARVADVAKAESNPEFSQAREKSSLFYLYNILPSARGLLEAAQHGSAYTV
jgi:alkylation response protein AidB-like acyl-CoA dehydrogenase